MIDNLIFYSKGKKETILKLVKENVSFVSIQENDAFDYEKKELTKDGWVKTGTELNQ